jgi:hypothetical protein
MKTQHYTLFISFAIVSSASCATKFGLSDDLYASLQRTSHHPSYTGLVFDKENVWDTEESLRKTSHKPDYTRQVVAIDHKGETLTEEVR